MTEKILSKRKNGMAMLLVLLAGIALGLVGFFWQFSIIRLERDAQVLVNVLDYAIPSKECCDAPGGGEDPCEMFSRIPFPATEFSPRDCDSKDDKCRPYNTTCK